LGSAAKKFNSMEVFPFGERHTRTDTDHQTLKSVTKRGPATTCLAGSSSRTASPHTTITDKEYRDIAEDQPGWPTSASSPNWGVGAIISKRRARPQPQAGGTQTAIRHTRTMRAGQGKARQSVQPRTTATPATPVGTAANPSFRSARLLWLCRSAPHWPYYSAGFRPPSLPCQRRLQRGVAPSEFARHYHRP